MAFAKKEDSVAVIQPANIQTVALKITGTAPYVQHKFSHKSRLQMMEAMTKTAAEKKEKKARPPRDYDDEFLQAQHVSEEGWQGIPCPSFRNAMIDACRTVGLVMTRAKMAVFILPDGVDRDDGTPLVKIISKKGPEKHTGLVRLESGVADVRIRPMWRKWSATVQIEFDADMISPSSVVNLLDRAGRQVGIGEGRPFSKNSCGQGWGTFTVVEGANE